MENWKPCPGFVFYEVSDLGRLRSRDKLRGYGTRFGTTGCYIRKGRVMQPVVQAKTGYHRYTLYDEDQVPRAVGVHRLIARAFHGEPPESKPWALHRDGNGGNNHASNLYWGSAKENTADAIKHGSFTPAGVKNYASKFTQDQVDWIRLHYAPHCKKLGAKPLGIKFGVCAATITAIAHGRTY